jgi:Na+/H+-dicarboxylate symporter
MSRKMSPAARTLLGLRLGLAAGVVMASLGMTAGHLVGAASSGATLPLIFFALVFGWAITGIKWSCH